MLVRPDSAPDVARREAGGKGYNLYEMTRRGLPVPPWVVLGGSAHARFVEGAGLAPRIAAELEAFGAGERSADEASAAVGRWIQDAALDPEARALIEEACARLGDDPVISVRSSAADEDSPTHSFAGQLSSFLYVRGVGDAARCLKACWASGYSARALAYRMENGLPLEGIRVAVIFQEMVDPDAAGVLFTCDPVASSLETYVVSAVYGVGEGLVSGALDADTYRLDAQTGQVVGREVVEKASAFRRASSGECEAVAVDEALRSAPALSDAQLLELHALGRRLAADMGRPQDIEWAVRDGRLHVLQTRPVTTLDRNLVGYPNLWDNSNIVESYGGLTLPLSFTFALENYRKVYVQFCEILRVPREVVKDMDAYLGNMLGCINGRVYYNLYNWYKLVGVLPGFGQNRQFMETMMGVREELAAEVEERVRPHPSWTTLRGRLRRARTGLAFLRFHFTIDRIVHRFLREFHDHYDHYRRLDYARMRSDEIFDVYLEIDRVMISRWKAPIINDFLCMVHFGVLRKLTAAWLGDLDPNLQNDLLAGQGNLESTEPTRELIRMAGQVAGDPALRQLVEATPAEDLRDAIRRSDHAEFAARVDRYIDRFGFRCIDEMKLEAMDLHQDPSPMFVSLKNYLRTGTTDLTTYEARERALRTEAEARVRDHLKGWRRWVYRWSLKHARKAVRNRENTRFARTRVYGVVRRQMLAMGSDLADREILEEARDIFYLTHDEVYGIHQGTLPVYALKEYIALRKREYERYEELEPESRFLTRGPVYWGNRFLAERETPDVEDGADYQLRGTPCCPGIIEGTVKVVEAATSDLRLDGEILVTPRTDPGWVPLYPSVSGLLIERGSLLSHSAIVAREMGLPAIVGIRGLTVTLETGMRVRMDGKRGLVWILDHDHDHDADRDGDGHGNPRRSAGAATRPGGARA